MTKHRSPEAIGHRLPAVGKKVVFLVLLAVLSAALPAWAFALSVPEVLRFRLSWAGLKAGETSLEVKGDRDELSITSTTAAASLVSVFYTVQDRVESRLKRDETKQTIGRPAHYRIQLREGRYRRDKEVVFNGATMKALYIDHLTKERKEVDVPRQVFDPLSGLYHLRTVRLEPGRSVFVPIFDSKKVADVEVRILGRETVDVPAGTFRTIVVKPLLKTEGIFSRQGAILIWLTDDEKKIPVQIKLQRGIGSVTAQLIGGIY